MLVSSAIGVTSSTALAALRVTWRFGGVFLASALAAAGLVAVAFCATAAKGRASATAAISAIFFMSGVPSG
ncbi:hypothetical protein FQZ97_1252030 [compost metagenome]